MKDFISNKDLNSRIYLNERILERKSYLNKLKLDYKFKLEHLRNIDLNYKKVYSGEGSFSVSVVKYKGSQLTNSSYICFNYSLQTSKLLNFQDFCKACDLIKDKVHLTEEGIAKLKLIKSGKNKGRKD